MFPYEVWKLALIQLPLPDLSVAQAVCCSWTRIVQEELKYRAKLGMLSNQAHFIIEVTEEQAELTNDWVKAGERTPGLRTRSMFRQTGRYGGKLVFEVCNWRTGGYVRLTRPTDIVRGYLIFPDVVGISWHTEERDYFYCKYQSDALSVRPEQFTTQYPTFSHLRLSQIFSIKRTTAEAIIAAENLGTKASHHLPNRLPLPMIPNLNFVIVAIGPGVLKYRYCDHERGRNGSCTQLLDWKGSCALHGQGIMEKNSFWCKVLCFNVKELEGASQIEEEQ